MKRHAWHSLTLEEVLSTLKTSGAGLSTEEAKRRLAEVGPNELVARERITPLKIFINQFKSFLVGLLIVAALISLVIGELVDSLAILFIIVMNSILGFVQEYRAERALEALKKLTMPKARVRRDGREMIIPAREVVPGDVIILEAGDRVPADARLLKAHSLEVNESMLTGESLPVAKDAHVVVAEDTPISERKNMVYMGTLVTRGLGEAIVVATGMNTEMGQIAEMIQTIEEEKTPLMRRLDRFGKQIGLVIVFLCLLTFILGLVRGLSPIIMFMTAVSLAVSAVPEGLPAIVTVTLALGVRDMARRNSIVRRLSSVETLGCTTVICSDKTGTMTKNEMTVRKVYLNGKIIDVTGSGYEPKGDFLLNGDRVEVRGNEDLLLLLRIGLLCNHAELIQVDDKWEITGDPTEGALLVLAMKAGLRREEELKRYPIISEIPFESGRKRMSTIHKGPDGRILAFVKGAPEVILSRCRYIRENGHVRKIDEKEVKHILNTVQDMALNALRVLALAYRELPRAQEEWDPEEVENDLTFMGLVGMIDPPREEVKEAIDLCRKAGIKVIMITGDHKLTAIAVAREIGLIDSEDPLVITGVELDRMSDEELERIIEDVVIFARVSPQHKVRIVKALKKKGHVVAMTGDGVNDAPALKMADIGVAMGIKGTDVAKEAADMILADDNFATIVAAVKAGREIYDNIRKFLRFLLSCNFDEIAVIATSVFTGMELPLLPLQILWINLITDGAPALALSVDPPDPDIMERPPRRPEEGILHGMELFVAVAALFQYIGTMAAFLLGLSLLKDSVTEARTLAFVQAVFFELFIVFNCRSERHSIFKVGFLTNKVLLLADLIGLLLTVALVYLPPLQMIFETTTLTLYDWILCAILASGGWFVLPEVFMRREKRRN
ncbi:MAG: calcium-transporting P-type ATPase, PMR1-type [Thermoprotei archaeon]|nr:calcium-transporting P-type ATPase, PMR1-type [Thermoprotei archaeon]